jgi:DNA (cytosine-5)-methyltransferase 1
MLDPWGDRPVAVGVHVFAGGHTVGVEQHFEVLAHLENQQAYGARTFKVNRPWVPVYVGVQRWPLDALRELGVDYVYCNPPCAIVSVAGRSLTNGRDSWRTDPRTNCIHECLTVLKRVQPRAFSIESVCQLFTRAQDLVEEMTVQAMDLDYHVTHLFVNAKWHGVPQDRRRYFFVATRDRPLAPQPLNYAPPSTVREVLAESDAVGFHYRPPTEHLYAGLAPGQGVRDAWERVNPPEVRVIGPQGVVGRPRMMEYRLRLDQPMGAFIGDFFVHPTEPRRIGIEEAKRLCRFPDDWQFACNRGGEFSELARGVMPPVAEWLARSLVSTMRSPPLEACNVRIIDLRHNSGESP